ncbi:hypothetical protein [Thermococcus sp. AM4]|uniref:hypothetical protein n=1 Tax=Thermococcus sp. (strain AM4) TaxID=246969 RepID=UPI0001870BEC|nr:hypothetical protein [Thermococcus sp. AM4]EEB74575.1 hypothetical protein TAM4_520 [Thermococcus sp. AM4]
MVNLRWRDIAIIIVIVLISKLVLLHAADFKIEKFCMRWDGEHFIRLAKSGYQEDYQLVFAPAFPLSVRLVSSIGMATWKAAFIVANFFSIWPPLLILRKYGLKPAIFFALNPAYVLFTTAPYSESMALTFAILAYLLKDRNSIAAGAVLGLSILTKYSMVLLFPAFLMDRKPLREMIKVVAPVAASGLVIAIFFTLKAGSPFVYFSLEKGWGSELAGPIKQAKWLLDSWFSNQNWHIDDFKLTGFRWLVFHWIFVIPYTIGLLLLIWEKRFQEALLSAPTILLEYLITGIPSVSASRLLLPAFPSWCVLGEKLGRKTYLFIPVVIFLLITIHYTGLWHMKAFFG